jgi:hypothetical protein
MPTWLGALIVFIGFGVIWLWLGPLLLHWAFGQLPPEHQAAAGHLFRTRMRRRT